MPYEVRRISLSQDELFQAVDLFHRLHPLELPMVNLASVRIHNGQIEVTMRPSRDSSVKSIFALTPAMAVRALVIFCLEAKVPLPRRADKTFCIEGGRATLLIELATGKAAKVQRLAAERNHRQRNLAAAPNSPESALADLMLKIETRTDESTV